jgi:hypothetical protein
MIDKAEHNDRYGWAESMVHEIPRAIGPLLTTFYQSPKEEIPPSLRSILMRLEENRDRHQITSDE